MSEPGPSVRRLASPDPGAGMGSGDSGPLDVAVTNPGLLTVSDADRIAFGAVAIPGGTARPGAHQLPLLGLTVTNTYTVRERRPSATPRPGC